MATPIADISTFTDEQKKLFKQAASLGSGVQTTNNGVTSTISSANPYTPESLTGSQKPIDVPQYSEPNIPDTSSLADLLTAYNAPNAVQAQAQAEKSSLLESLKGLLTKKGTEAERKAQLEEQAGIPGLNKSANELIQQIRQNNLGAFSASQGQEDRMAPTFAITGTQAQIERQRAVKNYGLAVAVEAINGNISLAQQNIERALDAEFSPLESQIEYQKLLLDDVKDTLSREDKKKADIFNIVLNERARILEQQKADKTEIYNVMKLAGQYGADAATIQKIQTAKTPQEALTLASKYLQDPKAKIELQKLKYETEKARLDAIKAASSVTDQPLPITGNIITDVASVISSNQVGGTTKTTLSAIVGVQSALEDFAKSAKVTTGKDGKKTYSIPGVDVTRSIKDATIPFTDINILPFRKAFLNEGEVKVDTFINGINLKVQQWASGAALTEAQTRQVERMTPKATDSDEVAVRKTVELYDFMNQQIRSALISEGIDFPIPDTTDIFSTQDSLETIFQ